MTNQAKLKSIKIPEARFKEAQYARSHWFVIAEYGTTLEDIKKPEYWAHVAKSLKPCDEITVISEDMTFKVNLDVLEASRLWARVFVTDFIEYTSVGEMPDTPSPDYKIKYAGPHNKYQVVRLSDSSVVKETFADEDQARLWLKDYVRATAA